MKIVRATLFFGASMALLLAACAPASNRNQPTSEESAAMRQAFLDRMAQARANGPRAYNTAGQPAPTVAAPAVSAISEDDLARKLGAIPNLTSPVSLEGRKDGFSVNGVRYLDPEGDIVNFSGDPATGDTTYAVQTPGGRSVIKFVRVGTNSNPVVMAYASRQGSLWAVQTVTGQNLNGDAVIASARGFLVARQTAVFQYTPGTAVRSFAIPDGFHVTRFQNGAVGKAGYVLVEKNAQPNDGGFMGNLTSLGSMVGVNKKADYALNRLDNGKMTPINIALEDNQVNKLSNCHRKSRNVNECSSMDTYASLYEPNGHKNRSHYYWRISWFSTADGPILIALEDGLRNLTVTDLNTGKKVIAYNRTMGITSFDAFQDPQGIVHLSAYLGGSEQTIPDVVKFLRAQSAVVGTSKTE